MLEFKEKKQLSEILDISNIDFTPPEDTSMLFFGENSIALKGLLPKLKGKIDLVYIDPPYNTNQSFAVLDGRANTISRSKSGDIAYSDHRTKEEYLSFMYERLILIHELLSEQGSLYVHIDVNMGHYLKVMLDEIFGDDNYKNDITRIKSNPKNFFRRAYGNQKDMILFYAKNSTMNIWNDIKADMGSEEALKKKFPKVDERGRYNTIPLHAPGESSGATGQPWRGMNPPVGRHWRTSPEEFDRLDAEGLIEWSQTGNPRIKKYMENYVGSKIQDIWQFKDPQYPVYPTEKNIDLLNMIVRQSSKENSYVLDCFAGSGASLLAAAANNRKFIGIDNSPIAIETIKRRLADYDYEYIEL